MSISRVVVFNTTLFRTKDGEMWNTQQSAEKRAAELEFIEWYEDHKLYGKYECCRIDAEEMLEWLKEHKDYCAVKELFASEFSQ